MNAQKYTLSQQAFFKSEEAAKARLQLQRMEADPLYNTQSIFSPSYKADCSFVDMHMNYLSEHLKTDVGQYLANLRLKTKIRS
ncbi:MAG TPA: hypothetical protein VFN51_01955 [Candidatus Saccharimonadales bacterium]|nr:hypothetical protein [Candidatus Saccharimonadales bacterium]